MNFITKHKWTIIGIALGAVGGFLYWHFVGCSSGQCAITSKPVNSTAYGSMMGGLLFSSFGSKKEDKNKEEE